MILKSSVDNITKRVAWLFPWRMEMRVKLLGFSYPSYSLGILKVYIDQVRNSEPLGKKTVQ